MSENGDKGTQAGGDEMVDLSYGIEDGGVSFVLDGGLYPLDAIYGAAYLFVDRCYLWFFRPADGQVGVRIRLKNKAESVEEALDGLAGEFANELLNQVVRHRVTESTANIRDYYMARAFFTDAGRASIDALLAELDAEELEEDPLEISVPWDDANAKDDGSNRAGE